MNHDVSSCGMLLSLWYTWYQVHVIFIARSDTRLPGIVLVEYVPGRAEVLVPYLRYQVRGMQSVYVQGADCGT